VGGARVEGGREGEFCVRGEHLHRVEHLLGTCPAVRVVKFEHICRRGRRMGGGRRKRGRKGGEREGGREEGREEGRDTYHEEAITVKMAWGVEQYLQVPATGHMYTPLSGTT